MAMTNNYTVCTSDGYVYVIQRRNAETGDLSFFHSFLNKVTGLGTEEEQQYWGNERWCESEDYAQKFQTFEEARAVFANLEDNRDCTLMMYVRGCYKNLSGTLWYPVKTFKV